MLTRLFSNLSLQSAISAFVALFILTLLACYLLDFQVLLPFYPATELDFADTIFKISLLIILPIVSLVFNGVTQSLGILKGSYHVAVICGLQLLAFFTLSLPFESLMAIPFAVLAFYKVFRLNDQVDPRRDIFDIGVISGFMTLFLPEGILFLVMAWSALFIYSLPNIKNLIIPIMGFFSVYTLTFPFFFLSDTSFVDFMLNQYQSVEFGIRTINLELLLKLIPILLTLVWGVYELLKNIGKATVKKRQVLTLNLTLLTLIVVAGFVVKEPQKVLVFGVFPASVLQANLVLRLKKKWTQDLIYILIVSSITLLLL